MKNIMRWVGLPFRIVIAVLFTFARVSVGLIIGLLDYEVMEDIPKDVAEVWRFAWDSRI